MNEKVVESIKRDTGAVSVDFSQAEVRMIIEGLNYLPHGRVRGLVDKILQKLAQSQKAPEGKNESAAA